MRLKYILALGLVITLFPILGEAKCFNMGIKISGEIVGSSTEPSDISVNTSPIRHLFQESIVIEKGKFEIRFLLSTFKKPKFWRIFTVHDCSWRPRSVILELIKGDHVVDRVELNLRKKFVEVKTGNYEPRSKVILHARPRKPEDPPSK